MARGRVLRTDSTSKGDNIILFSGVITVAAGKVGIMAFCSFKIVLLWKKLFKTLSLSLSSVYIVSLNSRGGMDVLLLGAMKVLSVVHQSFEERFSEVSFAEILS